MSEKKTESQEFDEKLRKDLEKQNIKKKEQFKKLMEDTKKKLTEKPKTETSQSIKTTSKISTSNKPKDPKVTDTCQISKTMSELSISSKSNISKAIEEEFQMSKTFTFMQPETSKVCQIPNITSKIYTSKSKTDRKFPEVCEMPKIASETYTSDQSKCRKIPEMHEITSKESTKLEASEILKAKMFQMPKTTSEGSIEFETPEIPKTAKMFQMPEMPKTTSEGSIEIKAPEIPETAKICQTPKTTSEESTKLETPEIPQVEKVCLMPKTVDEVNEESTRITSETFENPNVAETSESSQEVQTTSESSTFNKTEEIEMSKECATCNTEIDKIHGNTESCLKCSSTPAIPITNDEMEKKLSTHNKPKSIDDESTTIDDEPTSIASILVDDCKLDEKEKDDLQNFIKLEESQFKENLEEESTKSADDTGKTVMIPVIEKVELAQDMINARKFWPPMSAPNFEEHHLVLATHHLVPSLPIGFFEMFAEMIEVVTKKPVVLLYECRNNRPIATEIADIVILPAAKTWKDGVLLPASFVFDHRLNKDKSASTYADVIVAKDRAPHIQNIMDLRGYRCAVPNERHQFSAAGLLFNYLRSKGENMIFFGNILDASTQLEVLEMVASKQAEVGILESMAIKCNKYNVPGVDSLHILTSLGPLPPYRIMIKNTLVDELAEKLTAYLLNIDKYEEWLERLLPYGVIGFAKNSMDYYNLVDKKCVDTKVPYY